MFIHIISLQPHFAYTAMDILNLMFQLKCQFFIFIHVIIMSTVSLHGAEVETQIDT